MSVAISGLGPVKDWKAAAVALKASAASAESCLHQPDIGAEPDSAFAPPRALPPPTWTRLPVGAQLRQLWCPDPATQPVLCLGKAFQPCDASCRLLVRLLAVAAALCLGGGPLISWRLAGPPAAKGAATASPFAQRLAAHGEQLIACP